MNARRRIIAAAMSWAYSNARMLGYTADQAADEALEVAAFIRETMA